MWNLVCVVREFKRENRFILQIKNSSHAYMREMLSYHNQIFAGNSRSILTENFMSGEWSSDGTKSACHSIFIVWCLSDVETSIKSMLKSTFHVFFIHITLSFHHEITTFSLLTLFFTFHRNHHSMSQSVYGGGRVREKKICTP